MTMWSEQEGVNLLETREDLPQMTLYDIMLELNLVNPKVKIEGTILKLSSVACCQLKWQHR